MNLVLHQTQALAGEFGIATTGDAIGELVTTLKATAFKVAGQISDAQLVALLIVAKQYRLNPWTKEIYAFPDSKNGIVPVVGVDGWSRIINSDPNFDGMDFDQDAESCTCTIHRKDRKHPIRVTEYMAECKRSTGPWQSHPRRMLRHKAMIQCARVAFGFVGIYEPDEAERIVTGEYTVVADVDQKAQKWIDTIDGAMSLKKLDAIRADVIKDYGDVSKVPQSVRSATVARKRALLADVEVPEQVEQAADARALADAKAPEQTEQADTQ